MQHSPQHIISDILPAMQALLGAGSVMAEARGSAPNMAHFSPAAPAEASPLIEAKTPEMAAIFTLQQAPGM